MVDDENINVDGRIDNLEIADYPFTVEEPAVEEPAANVDRAEMRTLAAEDGTLNVAAGEDNNVFRFYDANEEHAIRIDDNALTGNVNVVTIPNVDHNIAYTTGSPTYSNPYVNPNFWGQLNSFQTISYTDIAKHCSNDFSFVDFPLNRNIAFHPRMVMDIFKTLYDEDILQKDVNINIEVEKSLFTLNVYMWLNEGSPFALHYLLFILRAAQKVCPHAVKTENTEAPTWSVTSFPTF